MYCKWLSSSGTYTPFAILIVAKCIVNHLKSLSKDFAILILIVAKCIVNNLVKIMKAAIENILIVAKCIVNWKWTKKNIRTKADINSSKVYCK